MINLFKIFAQIDSRKLYMSAKAVISLLFFLISGLPLISQAADKWLIAAQSEAFNTGQKISIDVIKPDSFTIWPDSINLDLSGAGASEVVELKHIEKSAVNGVIHTYVGMPKVKFIGVVRAELVGYKSNRMLMLAASNDDIAPLEIAATADVKDEIEPADANTAMVVLAQPGDEPPLSANEPLYFVVGSSSERNFDARFQLSFKYRPFDPDARVAQYLPPLSNLYFAYTQTSLWDLGGNSSPFEDTSYRPSVYYKWTGAGRGMIPDGWSVGLEHESNGRDGADSRSINTAYIKPTWNLDFAHGRRLTLSPKFYQYLEKSDNSDIYKYRGYVDFQARFGREDGAIVTALYRQGTGGYSSGQLDFSYPISDKLFGRTGTFIHLQLMEGYGETLIDYNRYSDTQLRLGLSLAR
jgi:outer membrane phospholipase A